MQKRKWLFLLLCAIAPLVSINDCNAQEAAIMKKIATSQGASSSLLFTVPNDGTQPITIGTFYHENESIARGGLPNFFHKMERGEKINVAFIGGSITQGSVGYRSQLAKYMSHRFSQTNFTWINAGVSGTGADLGAFRIGEQVLRYQPDLVFIEFAVNGAYQPGVEGMIRQIIKNNPTTDICLIYTLMEGQTVVYQEGKVPDNIQGLERLADHYLLPSIHLGMEASAMERKNELIWNGSKQRAVNQILFSADGIHPLKAGGDLYASAIARGLDKMKTKFAPANHSLIKPLFSDEWDHAGMYRPEQIALLDSNWTKLETSASNLKQFGGWFETIMIAEEAGASCSFFFDGDMFGIFDIGGPEAGQLTVWIDDKLVGLEEVNEQGYRLYKVSADHVNTSLNRFNRFCNNRYRGQYDLVQLPAGIHKITLKLSPLKADKKSILGAQQWDDILSNPERYDKSEVYLGRILLRGTPLTNTP